MKVDVRELVLKLESLAGIKEVTRIVNKLDDAGRAVLLQAISSTMTRGKKQQVIALLKSEVVPADAAIHTWIASSIPEVYVAGLNQARKLYEVATGNKTVKATVELLTTPEFAPHLDAVNSLLESAYLDFGNTMTGYVKGAERVLNETLKQQIRAKIAEGRLEGQSIAAIKRSVKQTFADRGFTVLIDRGGREWKLSDYSEMLVRTHIMKANNEAVLNRAADFDVDIVQIDSHGADDSLCAPQEGKIYSRSGNSEKYPPLDRNDPPYHPYCKHTLLLRPDLK